MTRRNVLRKRRWAGWLAAFVVLAAGIFGVGPTAAVITLDSGESTTPWIASDKDDYAPGEHVVLNGGNWGPGESVHIIVNDDEGQTWMRDVSVTADANGDLRDEFDLPAWFVAAYSVIATGAESGTATTTFTDGQSPYQEGSGTWTGTCLNPSNALSDNNSRATCDHSEDVVGSDFGLDSLVPATATNISFTVQINGQASNADNSDVWRVALSADGGTSYTSTTDSGDVGSSDVTVAVPATSCSSFGRTWSVGELTNANFRVRVTAIPDSMSGETMSIDDIDVRVCWDNYVVTAASLAGGTSAVTSPGGTVAAALTVNHENVTGSGTSDDWRSTSYQVEGQSAVCASTPAFTNSGTDSASLPAPGITAPTARGTFDVTFTGYTGTGCSGSASPGFTLSDALTVGIFGDSFGTSSQSSVPGWTDGDTNGSDCAISTRTGVITSNAHLRLRNQAASGGCAVTRSGISTAGLTNIHL